MRKKKLIERIEQLEKVVEFLSEYDKDEVAFGVSYNFFGLHKYTITYLYKGELKRVILSGVYSHYDVLKKSADYIIVEDILANRYYKIDKEKATCELIPKPAFVLEQELAEKDPLKNVVLTANAKKEKKDEKK